MSISFRVNDNGKIIPVKYDGEMTVEAFMLDYTKNHTNFQTTDPNIYLLKANCKLINTEKFKNCKLKDIIKEEQIMHFTRKKNMNYSKVLTKNYYQ